MSVCYNFQNAMTQTYLDLEGGHPSNGNRVLVYGLNQQPVGTPNQQVCCYPYTTL
jgi:hypothetical protein